MKLNIVIVLFLTTALITSSAFAHQWCWTSNQCNTYGWQLMTPDERKTHQAKLVSFRDYSTCAKYIEMHYKSMDDRAKINGVTLPPIEDNPCEALKALGKLK
ncbi:MAG: hypothetical protein PHH28_06120 [Desulfuromonadaceae bacterium]|nr:hypothetical protein [Desulfuromonadaceae bacterium]